MRYSTSLRTSRKHHILTFKAKGGLVAFLWLTVIFVTLSFLIDRTNLDQTQLYAGILVSFLRTTAAYVISLIFALTIALIMSSSVWIENLFLPIFDVLQSFPSFALFPVLAVALQSAPELVIIIVLVIAMIWPILFTVLSGLKNRRQDLEEAATIFGAKGWKRLQFFTFPELLPSIITGSIVGWGDGWELIIGAELLVSVKIGIGHYLGELGSSQQNTLLAFGIVALMFFLFFINKLIWLPLLHEATQYETET